MYGKDVFISAAREIDHQQLLFFRLLAHHFQSVRQRVGGFQRRDNSLMAAQRFEGFQRLIIGNGDIIRASDAVQVRMLRPNGREIEPAEME